LTVCLLMIRRFSRKVVKCTSSRLLTGKTVIITGANCGVGKATAEELAKRDAKVILACRDLDKAKVAIEDIRRSTKKGELVIRKLDLASLASVRQFCGVIIKEESRLDVLINNAAVMSHPYIVTEDGMEINMAVNHFGNFLLTNLLLDLMKKSSPSRIVFVSSSLHKFGNIDCDNLDKPQKNPYANSKLANVYFARELYLRLKNTGVAVHTLSPGMVATDLGRHRLNGISRFFLKPLISLFLKSPLEGSQTVVYCAVSETLDEESGGYYTDCTESKWTDISRAYSVTKKMWEVSEELTKLNKHD